MSIVYRAKTNIRFNKQRFVEGDVMPELPVATAAQLLKSDSIVAMPPAGLSTPAQRSAFNELVTDLAKKPGIVREAGPGEAGKPDTAASDDAALALLNEALGLRPGSAATSASAPASPAAPSAPGVPAAPAAAAKPKAPAPKVKEAKASKTAKGTGKKAAGKDGKAPASA